MSAGRYRRLAKEGGWVFAGQILAVAGSLALVRVLTEYLAPEQYGELALGLTVAGFTNQVILGGITAGIGRFYSIAAESHDLGGYARHARRLVGYGTIAVSIVAILIIGSLFLTGHANWIGLAVAASVFSVFSGYTAVLSSAQNAARQRASAAIHGGMEAWLKVLLSVGAILWLGRSSATAVLAFGLSSLLVCGSQLLYLRRSLHLQIETRPDGPDWSRRIWAYSWPFSLWGFFSWIQQASDRWALQAFGTTEEVGFYAVLFQLGYAPVGLATAMVMTLVGPILYQRSGDATDLDRNRGVHRLAWRLTWIALLITSSGFGLGLLCHEWVFDLLVAEKYHSVSGLLPWVVLAGGLFASGQVLSLKMLSDLKSATMTVAKVVTAILGVLLNIYGAARYGLEGVVAALVVFSTMFFGWMAWLAKSPAPFGDQKS